MRSLWGLRDLSREQLTHLLEPLEQGLLAPQSSKVALLMQEDSTRTWGSTLFAETRANLGKVGRTDSDT